MKKITILTLSILLSVVSFSQTNYYSKSTGNLEVLANWGLNTDGTGATPGNFTTASQVFNIRNRATATIGAAWTVSGAGSKIVVGDGSAINFTIPGTFAVTGTVDVAASATITINSAAVPTLGVLDATSTVVFARTTGGQSIPANTYNNMTLSNSSGTNTAAGALVVNGALVTTSGGVFALGANQLTGSLTSITHNGTITTTSTANPAIPTGKNWSGGTTGLVTFARTAGGQFIPEGTYKTLTCSNTSGTNTVNGNLVVTGAFTTSAAGGTLDMGLNTLTAGSVVNSGTILTQNTSSNPLPSGLTWVGTVQYNGSGAQTMVNGTFTNLSLSGNHAAANITLENGTINVSGNFVVTATNIGGYNTGTNSFVYTGNTNNTLGGITYNNLSLTNTSNTKTAGGNVTVNGTLTTASGGTFALGTNQLTGSLTSITHNGSLSTTSTANPAIPTGKTWTGTTGLVTFAATTGGQFIPEGTYKTLTCSNTSGTNTANGNLVITGAFTTSSAGGTFNLVTNTFTAGSIVNTGTLTTQNTSSTPLPTGITWGGTVNYDATTGAQTIMAGTYATLRLSNTSGTNTAEGNLVVNTLLNVVNSGSTLDMSTFTLTGTLTTITNNGTISISNTSATPIAAAKTWGGTGTVSYAVATGGQTLVSGTYAGLSFLNTSGTNTATGAVTANTSLTTTAGGTLDMSTFDLGGTLTTITNNGTILTSSTGTPITTGKSWGGTINYTRINGGQPILTGTYNHLTLSNTSGTNTASGDITVNGNLTTTAGGSFSFTLTTRELIGASMVVAHSGTLNMLSTAPTPIPSGKTWGGTVNFSRGTGGQSIPAGTYNNLSMTATSGTNTATGAIAINGAFSIASNATFDMSTFQLTGALTSVTLNGSLSTSSTANPAVPSGKTWNGTTGLVTFARTNGGQFIPAGTYKTLTCSNTSGTNTANGNLAITGAFTTSAAGGTMDMVTNTMSAATISNNGTLLTQNTSANPLPTGITWGGIVNYNATTGAQTIMAGTYGTLRLGNTSGTNTAEGNLVVNTLLNVVNASSTLDMSTFTLSGTLTTITNNGVISTSNTSATPIAAAKTWGGTGTVTYAVTSGGQTLVSGTFARLSFLNTSGTNTATGAVTLNNSLTTTAGGTLDMSTFALGGTLTTVTNDGILSTSNTSATPLTSGITWGGTGTVRYAVTTGAQTIMAGTYNNNLELSNTSGTNTASGVLNTNGTLTVPAGGTLNMVTFALAGTGVPAVSGTIRTQSITNPALPASKTWGGTVNFDRTAGAQFIPLGTFNNLTLSNTSGNQSPQGALTVNGTLVTTSGGSLVMGANQLLGSLTSITHNGTITTSSTANPAIPSGEDWIGGTTGLVTFGATTGGQHIPAGTYKTLTCSNTSGTNTAEGNLAITGAFTTSAAGGTLDMVTNTFIAGSIVNTGTLATQNTSLTPLPTGITWGGIVNYNATTGAQTIMAGTYATLRLSNTSGTNTASGNLVVNTLLNVVNAGSTLDMSTFALSGTLTTVTNNGVLSTSNMSATPLSSGITWGGTGTVRYAVTTGGQTVMLGTYTNNLELSNTSGTNTASGVLTTNGTLTVPAGGTLDMVTFAIAGTGVPAVSGTIRTQSTTNPAIPASKIWGGTVNFDRTAGAQSIPLGTYNNLTLSNTSGNQSAQGALTVNGALVTTSGGSLVMGANQLLGSLTSITHNGTITTTSTANPAIPTGKDWSGGTTGLVTFGATTGGQHIPAGTYKTLTCSNTGGTNTAEGNLAITGVFTTSSAGGTFNLVTNTFTAGSVVNTGTLQTQNVSVTPLTSGLTWGGVVDYNAATGGQTIVNGTYAGLRSSNSSGTNTAAADLVVNTLLSIPNAGGTLDMSTFALSGTLTTITNNGVLSTSNMSATPLTAGRPWGGTGTVRYAVTTGGQTVMAGTYHNNLELSNTSGTNTASGPFTTNGTLTVPAGGTLNMVTFALSGTGVPALSGTLRTQSTTNPPLPASKIWGGTVIYDRTAGLQFVQLGTYNNLTLINTSGDNVASGDITVNGTLTTTAGGSFTFNNVAFELIGASMVVAHSGILNTLSTTATPIPTGKTWGGTVNFTRATGGQSIPAGIYNNLSFSNTSLTNTAIGAIEINGTLTTTSGGIFSMSTFPLTGSLTSVVHNGTLNTSATDNPAIPSGKTWNGTTGLVEFINTTGGQFIPLGTYKALNCTNTSGTNTATGNISVTNTFQTAGIGGTFNMGTNVLSANAITNTSATLRTQSTSATPIPTGKTIAGTVLYDATTGGQTIVTETSYLDLSMSNTSGTNTANGNIVANGALTTGTGTSVFDLSTFTLSGTLTSITGGGSIKTQNTSAAPIKVDQTWPQLIEYSRAIGGQTVVNGTYDGGLTNSNTSGTNTLAAASNIIINGNLTLSPSSVLSDNSRPVTLNGNISGTGTHSSVTTGSITMTGAGSTISSVTLGNLTLNNAAGFGLTGNPQINGTLTFTDGRLDIANNILTFGTAAPAVAGSPASTKMIVTSGSGEVRKRYSGLGSFTFPIGDATPNYSPFTVNLTGGTPGGSAYVGVRVDDIKHPNNANADDYLNRFWHVNVSDITSPVYSISGNYIDADIVGDEADIATASYAGSLPWVTHGVVTAAANTIDAAALSGTNVDYSGINNIVTTVTVSPTTASYCSGGSAVFTASSVGVPGLTYTWSPATGLSATTGATVTASPTSGLTQTVIVYTVTVADGNGVSTNTTTTLSINPIPAAISAPPLLCPSETAILTSASLGGNWSSANASVMSVNAATGEITAVISNYSSNSITFITYTLPTSCSTSRMVTVKPIPAPIFGGTTALCLGETTTLSSGTAGHTWSSSTLGVATVAPGGVVTGAGAGTTTISYTNAVGCATTKVVTVNGPLPANTGTLSVCTGQTTMLANATPGGTWSTSNASRATVNSLTGLVSGINGGTVNISYRIGSTCFSVSQVTVNSNVALIGGTQTACIGTTTTLTYPVSGGTWSSATPAVATIDLNSGVVTGVGIGTSEITYTVAAGCFKTTVVTVTALPSAITGTALLCQAATTALSNGSGTWSSSNTGIATVNFLGTVTGVSAGNANITFRASGTGCYVTREVTVNPIPAIVSASVCPAKTATLTATPSGGTWSVSNPSVATINATTGELTGVIVFNSGISTTIVTNTLATGCSKTAIVTVNPVPSVISGGIRSICTGATTTLSSSTSGAVWSSTNTGVATISPVGLVTGIGSGTSTISYTNSFGCVATAGMTVSALPVLTPITGTQTVCMAATTTLASTPGGGTWSSNNLVRATVNGSGDVLGINPGTVRITYTVGSGCTAFETALVTVNALPGVTSILGSLAVCEQATSALSAISVGGVWSSSVPAVGSIGTNGVVSGITAGNTTISYTLTNGFGCQGRSTAVVTVNPSPVVAAITGTLSVCKDATTALSSVTGGGVWTSSTPSVATVGVTGIVTGVNTGTATISYTVTNGFGCVTRVTGVVTVNPVPVVNNVSGIYIVCENAQMALNTSLPLGTWTSSNIAIANIDTFAGVVTPVAVGTALMSYQVVATGCMGTREITVIEAPTSILGATAMCPGATATLTSTPGGGTWTTFNSGVISINATTGAIAAVIVDHFGISVTAIRYTIPNGCSRVVHPTVNPIPAPIYGGVTSLCVGETTTFLSGSLGHTWSSNNTGIATVTSGGVVTAQGAGVATISYTNAGGCANTRTITVNAALSPNVGSSSMCTGTTTLFSNALTGGTWTSSNISKATVNLTTGLVSASNAGTTTLSYRVPSGCYVTNVITVNTTPSTITGTRSVCIGTTTTLASTPSSGTWSSSADGIASVGSSTGIVSGVSSGTAIVTYTLSGCTRAAEVTVNALPASITGAGVTCAGGGTTALVNVSGTWTSSNTGIATVNYLGTVTGVASGNAIITFRNANNCSTTKEVTINPLPSPIVVPTGLCLGTTGTFTATPSGGTWASANPSVFSVDGVSGAMTALIANYTSNSLGTVTYTLPTGCVRTGMVTVNRQPGNIYGGTGRVCTGATTAQFSSATGCTWSSATPSVATISPTGVVTGVSAGNTVISYTSAGGCAAQRVITVNPTPDVITGATSVLVGQTTTLANATVGGTWSSSVTSKATIGSVSGTVTGMSTGTTNITYMMSTGCFVTRAMNVAAARGVVGEVSHTEISVVSIYPNPTTGTFSIATSTSGMLSMYTIDGKEVLLQQLSSGISSITLPNTVAAGFYTCKFTDVEGKVTIMRLVYDSK